MSSALAPGCLCGDGQARDGACTLLVSGSLQGLCPPGGLPVLAASCAVSPVAPGGALHCGAGLGPPSARRPGHRSRGRAVHAS